MSLEQNNSSSVWILILFFGLLYWFTGFSREEIHSYSARCTNGAVVAPLVYAEDLGATFDKLRNSIKSSEFIVGSGTRFSINSTTDSVTYRTGGLPILSKLGNCKILDSENWSCRFSDGSGSIGFVDGLRALPIESVETGYFYQHRWQYHVSRILNLFGPVELSWLIPNQVMPY